MEREPRTELDAALDSIIGGQIRRHAAAGASQRSGHPQPPVSDYSRFISDDTKRHLQKTLTLLKDDYSKTGYLYSFIYQAKPLLPDFISDYLDETHQGGPFVRDDIPDLPLTDGTSVEWFGARSLQCHDLNSCGYNLKLFTTPIYVYFSYILKQYEYGRTGAVFCGAGPGDCVIDGGSCLGDTALFFALKVGNGGRVFSFECGTENIKFFRKNMVLNPEPAKAVTLETLALWDKSETLLFKAGGPGGSAAEGYEEKDGLIAVPAISIDEYVERHKIAKIDFIKLDVEGAELRALKGAERTIKRFRPKMAVCLYHKLEHFWEAPELIDGYLPGADYYFDHFRDNKDESVLFIVPPNIEKRRINHF